MTILGIENEGSKSRWAWVAIRITLAWILLWAFLDKLLGLGFATAPGKAWIDGVSPTTGYLRFASGGWFGELFSDLANNSVVDALFMTALLLLGGALILGIGLKIAAMGGSMFFGLLWLSNFPPVNNPLVDEHVIYILAIIGIALSRSGHVLGWGRRWSQLRLVKKYPFLE